MSDFITKYWYLAVGVGVGAFSLVSFWLLSRNAFRRQSRLTRHAAEKLAKPADWE